MQLTRDLAARPFPALRILDLGCGDGVYAIEAGLRGAEVLAVDARRQRMDLGAACAARHGLGTVRFVQDDVRGSPGKRTASSTSSTASASCTTSTRPTCSRCWRRSTRSARV